MNEKIMEALKELKIPVTFQVYKGTAKTYITFFEYNMQNEGYSEDEIEIQGYYYQIDIWSVEDYTELVTKTKELLEANDFKFIDQEDLYEKDTKIFHKGLRYFMPNYR